MEYIRRIVDDVIDKRTEAFNAVSITGPKAVSYTHLDVYKRQGLPLLPGPGFDTDCHFR